VIARLNVGGAAMHAITLAQRLDPARFETVLATGRCAPDEQELGATAYGPGVTIVRIPGLGRPLRATDDLTALLHLVRLVHRFRPHVVHTHTAKAGALGRLAAWLGRVPVRVHTFHGHVFRGYFPRLGSAAAVGAERALALLTHRVIAVSESQAHELGCVYRIAPPEKVAVIPLGVDLDPFLAVPLGASGGHVRAEVGAAPDDVLVGIVGRVAPIKRHGFFLEAFARAHAAAPALRALVVGDGAPDDIAALRTRAASLGVAGRVHFLGYQTDMPRLYADLDVVACTSASEGTPVALIEGLAARLACVSTDVGGVGDVLGGGRYGRLVPADDVGAFAAALARLATDDGHRHALREGGAGSVASRFGVQRLLHEVASLYDELLAGRRVRAGMWSAIPSARG
jgi:glycosyltransferase involved in cell wall biosynthesis